MSGLPLLFTADGPAATPAATLQQALIAGVEAIAPGYAENLPALLVSDLTSTDVVALGMQDQARVYVVSSVSPNIANPYILAMQGAVLGLPKGQPANASVFVVFTGSPGYAIPPGFLIGDGTQQYVIQDGGTVGAGGITESLFAVATSSATFAIPANTVTQVVTSVPSPFSLTVTNALAGVPAQAAETTTSYRSRILNGQQVCVQGTLGYLETMVMAVPGVSPRLVSVLKAGSLWEVIVGGGDPYQVAAAIYAGLGSIGFLTGSTTSDRNITVSIFDEPDTYTVVYVNPPQQLVTVAVTWGFTLVNFVAEATVNQLIIAAVQASINSIVVGQPINLLVLAEQTQTAVTSVLAPIYLTTLEFAITIDGVPVGPTAGTSLVPGDPESWLFCSPTGVTAAQA